MPQLPPPPPAAPRAPRRISRVERAKAANAANRAAVRAAAGGTVPAEATLGPIGEDGAPVPAEPRPPVGAAAASGDGSSAAMPTPTDGSQGSSLVSAVPLTRSNLSALKREGSLRTLSAQERFQLWQSSSREADEAAEP